MSRDTTHEYVCIDCGVSMKGRERGGEVRATNAPASGEPRPCLCLACAERQAE